MLLLSVFEPLGAQNTTPQTKLLMDSARVKLLQQPDSSLIYATMAYKEAQENNNLWAMIKCLTYIGRVKEQGGIIDEAVGHYFDALGLMSKADTIDDYNTATLNRNIALIQANYFNFEQALSYYDSALFYLQRHVKDYPKIARADGDYRHVYSIRFFKGQTMRKLGNLDGAKQVFRQLLDDKQTPGRTQINTIYQIGFMYNDVQQPDSARKYFQLGLRHPALDSVRKGRGLHNLGMIDFEAGNFESAIANYSAALRVKRKLRSRSSLYITLLDLGESYLKLNRFAKADKYFQEALETLDEKVMQADPRYYNVYQLRANALMDTDVAISRKMLSVYVQCNEDFQRIQQQLRDQDQNRAFNLAMTNYWSEKEHNQEVKALDRTYTAWIWGMIIGFGITAYLGFQALRTYRRKRLFREIQKVTRDRTTRAS